MRPLDLLLLLKAQHTLMGAHIAALETVLQPTPSVTVETPARCEGKARCAIRDGEDARISRATLGAPHAWKCAGCGFEGGTTPAM